MNRSSISSRRGFTLMESLAVIAMIAIVLALISPAILAARDQARKTECINKFKQLGLGMYNYHDTYNMFPPGYVTGTKIAKNGSREMTKNSGFGWQAGLLPYMDQAPLYNQLSNDFNLGLPAASKLTTQKLSHLRCPADEGSALVARVSLLGPFPEQKETTIVDDGFARSNYAGVAGWDNEWYRGAAANAVQKGRGKTATWTWSKLELGKDFRDGIVIYSGDLPLVNNKPVPNARDYHGLFGENSSRRIRDLTDGAANCIAIGERATPTKNESEKDVGNLIWAGVPDRSTRAGQALALGTTYWPINHDLKDDSIPNTTGFNSRHGGGSIFMIGDGRVRHISESVDLFLLRRLSIIDDNIQGAIDIPEVK